MDFLRPAFDLYDDRDYCIVTLPHTAAEPSLLQWFTRVPPTQHNTFGHVLYIIHRDAVHVSEHVRVRWIRDVEDVTAVGQLTMGMEHAHDVMGQCKQVWGGVKQAMAGGKEKPLEVEEVMKG